MWCDYIRLKGLHKYRVLFIDLSTNNISNYDIYSPLFLLL